MSLQDLDTTQLFELLLPLDEEAITAFCRANRMYAEVCRDKYFWRQKYIREYGQAILPAIIDEFPDVYPENWHLAYRYRTLTNKYQHIILAQQYTPEDILNRLTEGILTLDEITPSSLQQLGLWDETAWLNATAQKYPQDDALTKEDYLDLGESDNTRIGDKTSNLQLYWLGDQTTLVGFTDRLNEEIWFYDEKDKIPEISADTIVTPRIIKIQIDLYDGRLEAFAVQRRGMPPGSVPESIYTYVTDRSGFTLRKLVDNIIDAVKKYTVFAHLAIGAITTDLHHYGINDVLYEDGIYRPQLRTW